MAAAFAAASASAAAAVGALLGALGGGLAHQDRLGIAAILAVLAVGAGVTELVGRRPHLPERRVETPQKWVHAGVFSWAVLNGSTLGTGFQTRIGFGAWYAIPLSTVVLADPSLGAYIYGAYGLARGLGVWTFIIAARIATARGVSLPEVSACALGLRPLARRVSGAQLVFLGATALIVMNG